MAFLAKRRLDEQEAADSSDDEEYLAAKLFSGTDASTVLGSSSFVRNQGTSDEDEAEERSAPVGQQSKTVWYDEDDELDDEVRIKTSSATGKLLKKSNDVSESIQQSELKDRLRGVYCKVASRGKQPKWAKIEKVPGDESDDEVEAVVRDVTRSAAQYIDRPERLPRGAIGTRKLQDIAIGHSDAKAVNVLRFHKSKPVLIAAGDGGLVRLFQVDNEVKKEHFLQSIFLKKFPVTSCEIVGGGSSLLLGSRSQTYFMRYNMDSNKVTQLKLPRDIPHQNCGQFCVSRDGSMLAMVGNRGQVYIMATASLDHIHTFSAPSEVVSIQFFPGSSDEIWALTVRGEVFVWQIASRRQHSFLDDGAVRGSSLTLSPDGNFLAVGQNTGFINVYDVDVARKESSPKIKFNVSNLVTSVGGMVFNHDSQMLAISSSVKKNQVRIVHTFSESTFQNFPIRTDQIPHVKSLDFSPHSGFLSLGLDNGQIRTYRMEHFDQY